MAVMALLIPFLPLGCAAQQQPSPSLGPALGHSQPLADESASVQPSEPAPEPEPEPVEPEPTPAGASEADAAPTKPSPAAVTEEDEALCRHITRVVLSESNNAAGLNVEQIDELVVSCSLALAHDRHKLSEAEFRRRAECVREASTVAGFSACQPR